VKPRAATPSNSEVASPLTSEVKIPAVPPVGVAKVPAVPPVGVDAVNANVSTVDGCVMLPAASAM